MPDLFCHALSGYVLLRPKWKKLFIPSVFLLGCIFPDLVRGPVLIFSNFFQIDKQYTFPLLILHSPLPLLFQAWLISQFFEYSIRLKIFKNLLAGIITDGDLRRVLDAKVDITDLSISDVMTKSPVTVAPGLLAAEVVAMMRDQSINGVVVLTEGRPVGAFNMHDLLKAGVV